jgi:hypothetical protein
LTWNADLKAATLHALQPIAENEEITISYVATSDIDTEMLEATFGFKCKCHWCLSPIPENEHEDTSLRRQSIDILHQQLKNIDNVVWALKVARGLLELFLVEKIKGWR